MIFSPRREVGGEDSRPPARACRVNAKMSPVTKMVVVRCGFMRSAVE